MNKVNLDNFTVEYNGNIFDMNDLHMLSLYYDRLCTAEFLYEEKNDLTIGEAYEVACYVRYAVDDICDCENLILDERYTEFLAEVRAEALEN